MAMIRAASVDDLDVIDAVERQAGERFAAFPDLTVPPDVSPGEELREAIEAGLSWVVEDDQGVFGFLYASVVDDGAFVEEVSVLPRARGGRWGAKLIDQLGARARTLGLQALTLTTFRDVPWNAPYYRRLGFVDVEPSEGLQGKLAAEVARGFRADERVVMRRSLR